MPLGVKLIDDGEEISMNDFVEKIVNGAIVGIITSLHGKEGLERD